MTQEQTITIDNQEHKLADFPETVQNMVHALAKAEGQFLDQQYELNKTGIFLETVRAQALKLAKEHLTPIVQETPIDG